MRPRGENGLRAARAKGKRKALEGVLSLCGGGVAAWEGGDRRLVAPPNNEARLQEVLPPELFELEVDAEVRNRMAYVRPSRLSRTEAEIADLDALVKTGLEAQRVVEDFTTLVTYGNHPLTVEERKEYRAKLAKEAKEAERSEHPCARGPP